MHVCGLSEDIWEDIYDFLSFRSRKYRTILSNMDEMCENLKKDSCLLEMSALTAFRWKRAGLDYHYSFPSIREADQMLQTMPMKLFRDMVATLYRQKLPCIWRDHVRYRPCGLSSIRRRVGILAHYDRFIYICENLNTGRIRVLA
jgi:hypothetical protein